jgi:hypothetical protein
MSSITKAQLASRKAASSHTALTCIDSVESSTLLQLHLTKRRQPTGAAGQQQQQQQQHIAAMWMKTRCTALAAESVAHCSALQMHQLCDGDLLCGDVSTAVCSRAEGVMGSGLPPAPTCRLAHV